ncbi:ASPIC/UnbV domain-containing protein, partial [Singulisphaera rosea]
AVGDLDRDGRPDVVVNALDAPAAILRNVTRGGRRLILELAGPSVGARILVTSEGHTQVKDLVGGGSYLSASDRRVFIGVGVARRVERLDVAWPSGRIETWSDLETDRLQRLVEGSGVPR